MSSLRLPAASTGKLASELISHQVSSKPEFRNHIRVLYFADLMCALFNDTASRLNGAVPSVDKKAVNIEVETV
jgi:hypothetical protein